MSRRNRNEQPEWKHRRGAVPGTFSIAAVDPETGKTGVAVSTALVAVGGLCPFVSENAAVATQSFVKVSHGKHAIDLSERGVSISTACEALIEDDEHAGYRQLHTIDSNGEDFTFSGDDCVGWYGETTGENHTVAGNMLENGTVIQAVSDRFEDAGGSFSARLLEALEAGQEAGGDKRGKISAALLVHAPEPKLYHNLRVDNSDDPVGELREAYELGRETEEQLPEQAEDMLGDYPEEILNFGLKY
ncbi:DUF1028 domain-containing protein [Halorubrum alkaliphilum]|uniref:DUF1028 domain-containing protein n=1 Tax=Halorubrum alkaliphilum TaxID=261290 RepID=UPI001AE214B8